MEKLGCTGFMVGNLQPTRSGVEHVHQFFAVSAGSRFFARATDGDEQAAKKEAKADVWSRQRLLLPSEGQQLTEVD